jgi:hypothetical protein
MVMILSRVSSIYHLPKFFHRGGIIAIPPFHPKTYDLSPIKAGKAVLVISLFIGCFCQAPPILAIPI